ncbi:glycolate oxidase subunit GlcF [Alphaproteobacteria bacterium LSUCC0684]
MQTNFTTSQLKEPDIARADSILRKCVHCGFCTATCPTYVETGDERDSPRGRIWLIRDLLEGNLENADTAGHHLDRCLTCLSCMSTCPSGVDYMHLVDIGRRHADKARRPGWAENLRRRVLVSVLPHAGRAYVMLMLGWLARPFRVFLPSSLRAMLDVVPARMPRLDKVGSRDVIYPAASGTPSHRVALLAGCAQRAIDPSINAATIRLLNRRGVEVVVRRMASCCGAVAKHTGDEVSAEKSMAATIRAFADEKRDGGLDAIIINTSGCGTTVKDYGDHFASDEGLAADAAAVSAMAMDITEFLDHIGLGEVDMERSRGLSVAYHAACSLQHGQQIRTPPKDLLRRAGFEVREVAESHLCCGSAGTYNVLQPELAGRLKARKLRNINAAAADIVAAGNIGCINQLSASTAPILHTVQLLDWATGGPKPAGVKTPGLKSAS